MSFEVQTTLHNNFLGKYGVLNVFLAQRFIEDFMRVSNEFHYISEKFSPRTFPVQLFSSERSAGESSEIINY